MARAIPEASRIVVNGGTGFVGRAVVDRLLESGESRICVTSRDPGRRDPWQGRVEIQQAFAGDALSLGRAFTRADVVVQCVQFENHPVEEPAKGRTYQEVDARGTRVAARVARDLGVRRFVYLSGAGAGRDRPEPWFRAKDAAEAAVRQAGMEFVILRPSWIYGPGDRSLSRYAAWCRYAPLVPVIGNGTTAVYPVLVSDVARSVVESIHRADAHGQAFDLGGPERLTIDQVLATLQDVLGTRRPLLHHPAPLMRLLARILSRLPGRILSPSAVDFLTQTVAIDPGPAQAFFRFPFTRLKDGLRSYLQASVPSRP